MVTAVNGAVACSLDKVADPISECVPARVEKDPTPIRFTVTWQRSPVDGGAASASATTFVGCATAATTTGSHEIVARIEVSMKRWREMRGQVLDDIALFAEGFRITEQRYVLGLLCASENKLCAGYQKSNEVGSVLAVERAVALLNGAPAPYERRPDARLCRLLATGEIVRIAQSWGAVEDAIDVRSMLPSGVGGLVIPTVGGPVIERVVDDVVLTSGGLVDDVVCFTLTQQFFLTNPDRAVALVLPRHWTADRPR